MTRSGGPGRCWIFAYVRTNGGRILQRLSNLSTVQRNMWACWMEDVPWQVKFRFGVERSTQILCFSASGEVSFGSEFTRPKCSLTKKPRLYVKAPDNFALRLATRSEWLFTARLISVMNMLKLQEVSPTNWCLRPKASSLYLHRGSHWSVGTKWHILPQHQCFCGFSGAVVFLVDQGQKAPKEVTDGMAIGIHVGGLDRNNNIAFMLK